MRNTFTFAFVALAASALAAQSQSSGSQGSTQSGQHGNATVVTGCLTAGPNNTFTLTAPDPNGGSSGSSDTATGTTGSTATTPAGSKVVKTISYMLTPSGNVDLKSHLNHKVQVSGSESPAQASTTSVDSRTSTSPSAQGTSGKTPTVQTTAQAQIVARQFTVESIKPVSDKCDILK